MQQHLKQRKHRQIAKMLKEMSQRMVERWNWNPQLIKMFEDKMQPSYMIIGECFRSKIMKMFQHWMDYGFVESLKPESQFGNSNLNRLRGRFKKSVQSILLETRNRNIGDDIWAIKSGCQSWMRD